MRQRLSHGALSPCAGGFHPRYNTCISLQVPLVPPPISSQLRGGHFVLCEAVPLSLSAVACTGGFYASVPHLHLSLVLFVLPPASLLLGRRALYLLAPPLTLSAVACTCGFYAPVPHLRLLCPGALCTLYGYLTAQRLADTDTRVTVISFASPCVGNHAFRHACDALGNLTTVRVAYHHDVVPGLPVGNYYHVGKTTVCLRPHKDSTVYLNYAYPCWRFALTHC